MTLYIQAENYHFDGYVSGVIVDEEKNRVALYEQSGVMEESRILPPIDDIKWYDLESVKENGSNVEIKGKNYSIYRKFFCLNRIEL